MLIKLNSSQKSNCFAYIINETKQLTKFLSKKEVAFLNIKESEKTKLYEFSRLETSFFIIKIKSIDFNKREKIRLFGSEITSKINQGDFKNVQVQNLTPFLDIELDLSEGLSLANYQFIKYLTDKKNKRNSLTSINIISSSCSKEKTSALKHLIDAVFFARDLVNEPASFLTAVQMADEFKKNAEESNIKIEIFNQKKIESLKMGGLLSVNKGSVDPATFTVMEWKPNNPVNKKPIVLVGKGVVYDTGGLSLKPTPNSMDIMKCDMGGAATVAGAFFAVAKSNIPVHLISLIPATDNRPGGNAYAPGDIIKMFDQTSVEVLNTDAEGRLILADALSYAKKYDPELVIDAATLTGAALRAIGDHAAVIMGTASEKVFSALETASKNTYERVVQFPLWDEYADELKSPIADIKNLGGANAGSITAGKFLEHFTGYPWMHLDIAGPAWKNSPKGYLTTGGTGYGVRLLFDFLKNYQS
jgi:leucyl aminopeptidase